MSVPIYAKAVRQYELGFPVQVEKLLNDEIHYFFTILSPRKLAVHYPELYNLDSLSMNQEDDVGLLVNKSVSVISRPVGFFDDKQLVEEKFVKHILGDQKVEKRGPDSFKITVPGVYSYKMQSFFDADDVSTLPNSKVIRAVTAARNLDVISKSASTIMFTEKTNYSRLAEGGVSVSSFIPFKENSTLVITYNIYAIKKAALKPAALHKSFVMEIEAVKTLLENYKD
jgi:hypothetical protein